MGSFVFSRFFWVNSTLAAKIFRQFLPLGLTVVWTIFNGCPLTLIDPDLNDEDFIQVVSKLVGLNLDRERLRYLTINYLLLITIVSVKLAK